MAKRRSRPRRSCGFGSEETCAFVVLKNARDGWVLSHGEPLLFRLLGLSADRTNAGWGEPPQRDLVGSRHLCARSEEPVHDALGRSPRSSVWVPHAELLHSAVGSQSQVSVVAALLIESSAIASAKFAGPMFDNPLVSCVQNLASRPSAQALQV